MSNWVLGMDIGGTNIRIGRVMEDFSVCDFQKKDCRKILTGEKSVGNLMSMVDKYLQEHSLISNPQAISLGFPATIDRDKKYVVSGPNIKGLDRIRIVDLFEEKFKIPTYIDRDVNINVAYDLHKLDLKSGGIIIACYIGTGFGNAIVINNTIYSGYSGAAGELGHMPVLGMKDICGCGNEGCIENYTGGKQLEVIGKMYFPDTKIKDIFHYHNGEPVIEDFVEALSIPIASEINILDPEYVIIGGGVTHMRGFSKKKLEKYIRKHTRKPFPESTLKIRHSVQKQENGVIGAGICAFKNISSKKEGAYAV